MKFGSVYRRMVLMSAHEKAFTANLFPLVRIGTCSAQVPRTFWAQKNRWKWLLSKENFLTFLFTKGTNIKRFNLQQPLKVLDVTPVELNTQMHYGHAILRTILIPLRKLKSTFCRVPSQRNRGHARAWECGYESFSWWKSHRHGKRVTSVSHDWWWLLCPIHHSYTYRFEEKILIQNCQVKHSNLLSTQRINFNVEDKCLPGQQSTRLQVISSHKAHVCYLSD